MRSKEEVVEVSTGSESIKGRYERFNTKLGQGAFKTVYKAFDTFEQIDVAWNCIDLSCINIDTERDKIFKECEILRKLNHPHILKIADQWYDEENGHLNFITNIVHDGSLSKYFKNRSINLLRIKKIGKQILSAIAYLHENDIIHRDLKGDNIFIEGNTGDVVIGDLGLSCNIISARSIVGTPHFMAPELFKEEYDEMVDIWSFGMVILELVTKEMPYQECKGAFQAYQSIISGNKPLILTHINNNYIRSFIDICLNLNPKLRPTAIELLDHPFLLQRAWDQVLCNKYIKPINKQFPEPPKSPSKPNEFDIDNKENTYNKIATNNQLQEPTPISLRTLSEEKVIIQNVDIIDDNKTKITMQIFSNSFADKIMTVGFDYDETKDKPQSVAKEMVQALQLKDYFNNKIENGIIAAIKKREKDGINTIDLEDEKEDKKSDEPEKDQSVHSLVIDATTTNDEMSIQRRISKESMKMKEIQDTEIWLKENGLSELIATFNKEKLTMVHFMDITDDMIKEMCDQMGWNIVTRLKLKKAVQDLKPITPQQMILNERITTEQTQIFDELNQKHHVISRDIKQVKDAINDLERSAKECNNAVYQNCEEMIGLIEQDRDKLLNQIKMTKDKRKQELEISLNTLNNINNTMINTQQQCRQISVNNDITPMLRLQNIKQIVNKSKEEEKKNIFNNTVIDKSNYKLKLHFDLKNFINILEESMKLEYLEDVFELIYNNDISSIPASNSIASIKDIERMKEGNLSSLNLYDIGNGSPTPITKKQSIEPFHLDFNESQFIMDSNIIQSGYKRELKSILSPSTINTSQQQQQQQQQQQRQQQQQQQEPHKLNRFNHINPTNELIVGHTRTHNERTQKLSHRRAQSATGLIQSDTVHHHISPVHAKKKRASISLFDDENMDKQNEHNTLSVLDLDDNMDIISPFPYSKPTIFVNMEPIKSGRTMISPHSLPSPMIMNHTKRRNTKKNVLTFCDRDELLVDGYIRKHSKYLDIILPHQIYTLSWKFYHFDYELLKFSKSYKSKDGWRFYDGNTCIKRLKVALTETSSAEDNDDMEVYQNYKWILLDIKPIYNDNICCWRIFIRNPNKGLIVIGICKQEMFRSDKQHQNNVYGIGISENKWYPINHNKHNKIESFNHLNKKQCQIDMKLDAIKGILSFIMVHNEENDNIYNNNKKKEKEEEIIINGLPLNNNKGWIPYFNSYQNSVGSQLKIALCPISWYGTYRNDIFD